MNSKTLALAAFATMALQSPVYACDKNKNKKEVTKQERKELRKKRLTKKLKNIKRRLKALEENNA